VSNKEIYIISTSYAPCKQFCQAGVIFVTVKETDYINDGVNINISNHINAHHT